MNYSSRKVPKHHNVDVGAKKYMNQVLAGCSICIHRLSKWCLMCNKLKWFWRNIKISIYIYIYIYIYTKVYITFALCSVNRCIFNCVLKMAEIQFHRDAGGGISSMYCRGQDTERPSIHWRNRSLSEKNGTKAVTGVVTKPYLPLKYTY